MTSIGRLWFTNAEMVAQELPDATPPSERQARIFFERQLYGRRLSASDLRGRIAVLEMELSSAGFTRREIDQRLIDDYLLLIDQLIEEALGSS